MVCGPMLKSFFTYKADQPNRRLKFVGSELRGFHAEERSVAGLIVSDSTTDARYWTVD